MKRCPECRRDYYDDTLLYCLDDGNALLEGPASMDGPAILDETDARCPECGRDNDDSLSFCLDDGRALLEGPASGSRSESHQYKL